MLVLRLCSYWRSVRLTRRGLFYGGRSGGCSAWTTVKAHVVDGGVVDDRPVVGIVNGGDVYSIDGRVVVEAPAIPIPSFIPSANVSETVVDATVEADFWTPVAGMPNIYVIFPAPITGGP